MKIGKHLTVLAMLCGAAAMNSCVNDELGGSLLTEEVSILAKSGQMTDTRSCVDNDNTGGTVGILWMPEDKIGVYGDAGTINSEFSSANSSNAPEAIFRGLLQEGEKPAVAYFPYDKANDNSPSTAVIGNLSLEQPFDMTTGKLHGDYKIGKVKYSSDQWEFTFDHLFSLLRFNIDATGTALAGDHLESITLTLPSGRRLGGDFTVNINDGTVTWAGTPEKANEIIMQWTDTPALESGKSYTGYITCAPDIRKGDEITITIKTANFVATFTKQSLVDFQANTCYTFPLALSKYADEMEVTPRIGFSSFVFEASKNSGKILSTKLVPKSDKTGTVTTTVSAEALEIGPFEITGCIPYLYNFKLIPTFTVSDGAEVTVDGVAQESGVTEQDFSKPVTYKVTKGEEVREYTVKLSNTGLPVVVITQGGGMDTEWKEAGISVRSKDSDWVETDRFAVYNPDGTTDVEEALCGVRLRGNSTQKFPKKPFAIKLTSKASVLGMPKHKRWVLLANWMDRTMIRNSVAFAIAHKVDSAFVNSANPEEGGIGWSPRGESVELVIDGRHVGNYLLCEQIKIDGDRVDIKDAIEDIIDDGNANPTVADCGYLLEFDDNYDEVDKFRTGRGLPCMFKDEVSKFSSEIYNSVKSYIENVESLIEANNYTEYEKVLDINSVIDYWFIQELVFNDEYKHPKSVYMIKDGDGKLAAGPVWDFDWLTFCFKANVDAMNSKYNGDWTCSETNEWLYGKSILADDPFWPWENPDYTNDRPYMWYPLLFKSETFRTAVTRRWPTIYSNLLNISDFISKVGEENRISEKYNSEMWPLVNIKSGVGSAFNGDEEMTYDEAIESVRKFYTERLSWMNGAIMGNNFVTNAK